MRQPSRYLLSAALGVAAGSGLGEACWRIAQQAPAFPWPAWGRSPWWAAGVLAAALLAALLKAAEPWLEGAGVRKVWSLAVGPWALGWSAGLAQRVHLPPPHDQPIRSLQIALAGCLLTGGGLALVALVLRLREVAEEKGAAWTARRLFALAFIGYALAGAWTGQWLMTGDAPHYLVITDSLVHDRDTDLRNQYREGVWRAFYDGPVLAAQFAPQPDGREISLHRPGVPLLDAPAYALLGAQGVRCFQAGLAAAAAALLFLVLADLGYTRRQALLGWALMAGSAAWVAHACSTWAEQAAAGALVLVWASWRRLTPAWWAGLAAGWLLLVNVRFYPASGWLLLVSLYLGRGRIEKFKIAAAYAVALAVLAWFNLAEFGSLDPLLPFRQNSYGAKELAQTHRFWGNLAAVFLDQEYGFLAYGPAFAPALLGWVAWVRRSPQLALQLLPVVAATLAPVALFINWHGDMAPARYLILLTPLFAAGTVEAVRAWGLGRAVVWLAIPHWALGLAMAVFPWLAFSKKDGRNVLLSVLERLGGWQLTQVFPSFIISSPAGPIWAWGALAILLMALLRLGAPAPWKKQL